MPSGWGQTPDPGVAVVLVVAASVVAASVVAASVVAASVVGAAVVEGAAVAAVQKINKIWGDAKRSGPWQKSLCKFESLLRYMKQIEGSLAQCHLIRHIGSHST